MAYPEWTGGWLGVAGKQMEDFKIFIKNGIWKIFKKNNQLQITQYIKSVII